MNNNLIEHSINDREYRIKEYCDIYTIQICRISETGMLWWKKTKRKWITADEKGHEYHHPFQDPAMYPTLKMAVKQQLYAQYKNPIKKVCS